MFFCFWWALKRLKNRNLRETKTNIDLKLKKHPQNILKTLANECLALTTGFELRKHQRVKNSCEMHPVGNEWCQKKNWKRPVVCENHAKFITLRLTQKFQITQWFVKTFSLVRRTYLLTTERLLTVLWTFFCFISLVLVTKVTPATRLHSQPEDWVLVLWRSPRKMYFTLTGLPSIYTGDGPLLL